MSFIAGLNAKDCYLYFANGVTGVAGYNKDIVKLSNYCGALILTGTGSQLTRLKEVLRRFSEEELHETDDLSDAIVDKVIMFFRQEFQDNHSYKTMPLTFLLLVVGTNRTRQGAVEFVYIRNRVKERIEKDGQREFVTVFDREPAVPARNIFYGESNIIEYLASQLSCPEQDADIVKLMACFSVSESDRNDDTSLERIRMASLTAEKGFVWTGAEEVLSLMKKAEKVHERLEQGLKSYLSEEKLLAELADKG